MHSSPHVETTPAGTRGLHALVRGKDGWAVQQAVVTVTDMSGHQVARVLADAGGTVVTEPLKPGVYTVVVTAAGYSPIASTAIATASGTADLGTPALSRTGGAELPPSGAWTVHGELVLCGITRPVDLDLRYLGAGPGPWGGMRAAFRAVTELHREDFAMNFNQVVQAGISVIGATLKVELDIQAVRGESLPPA
jgi:hypothetical protein